MKITNIALALIFANYSQNVRFESNYGDIESLADNIQAKGLLTPLCVEKQEDGNYAIISGHRRYAALMLLVDRGVIKLENKISCIVEQFQSDIERVAAKLLANDGQPLTADEWAAEIGRLAETGASVRDIAAALGKNETYVSTMKTTWERMNPAARDIIKSGKVSMSLAIVMSRKTLSPTVASLGVSIAAAVKEKVEEGGEKVSDKVLGESVIKTTEKIMEKAKRGESMSGAAIGEDIMANIGIVKQANVAASKARAQVMTDTKTEDHKPVGSLATYIGGLLAVMDADKFNKAVPVMDALNMITLCHQDGVGFQDCINRIAEINKSKAKA